MKNCELMATNFMQVFLAAQENTSPPLFFTSCIRDNLPFHQRTTFIMTTPIYCILQEASPLVFKPSTIVRKQRVL